MRHDGAGELFAQEAKRAFRDVELEPPLVPLSGEEMKYKSANLADNARSDIRVRCFWTNMRNAFFDVKVFYPFAQSYLNKSPETLYKEAAGMKKREYEQRIRDVEDGDFTPLVMSSSGGMCAEMQMALKHLGHKIAEKQNESYAKVIGILRCKFAFIMMRSAIVCLRGSRSIRRACYRNPMDEIDLAAADLRL